MGARAPEATKLPRGCAVLLAVAAPLVPPDLRADWLREWRTEVAWCASRPHAQLGATRLLLRCLGAFVHAAWLRWDRRRCEMLLVDLRYALRGLARRPGFSLVTVLTLAIGIGANAAIFGAVRAVLLRPLPFPQPQRLVQLFTDSLQRPGLVGGSTSPPDFVDWRRDTRAFSELAAVNAGSYALTGQGAAEQVSGAAVSGGFFPVMGVPARHGRTLVLDDDRIGGPEVVVLGHALWTRRFGGDSAILGRRVLLDGVSREVVGVMPEGFAFPLRSELWIPLHFTAEELNTQRGAHYLDVVGRLRPAATLENGRSELRAIGGRLAEAHPQTNRDASVAVHPLRDALVGDVRPALLVLLGAVGFVLVVVCVNVAGLTLTQALGRSHELAIRLALGAGRGRLVRGLLIESLVLALAGGAGGFCLAWWATQAIAAFDQGLGIPLLDHTRVDATVLVFTLGLSLAAALLFGTLPAWQASAVGDVARRIRETSHKTTGARQRLRSLLIVAETALAVVLLVGAGLLARSFSRLMAVDLGFSPAVVQTLSLSLPEARYREPWQRAEFVDTLVSRVAARPDVEAAGAIFGLPLTHFGYVISTSELDGRRLDAEEQDRLSVQLRVVTPDYFRAMGIRVVRGRSFADGDRLGAPAVAVVDESAAAHLWPAQDPIGHRIGLGTRLGQGGERAGGEIVGVVADVRDQGPQVRARPTLYVAHRQFPIDFVSVVVRARRESGTLVEPVRAMLAALDPDIPVFRLRTMEQIAADVVAQPRLYMTVLGAFAASAMLLAGLGFYGVLTHSVGQRTREIGIRIALGAARHQVVRMVVTHASRLALAGILLGLGGAVVATRALAGLLFGVPPTDAATYLAVAIGLLAVALIASWLPARRAARIDPVEALRFE